MKSAKLLLQRLAIRDWWYLCSFQTEKAKQMRTENGNFDKKKAFQDKVLKTSVDGTFRKFRKGQRFK